MQCVRTEGKKMASAQPTGNKLFSLILLSFFSFCSLLHFITQHPFLGYTYAITKIVIF